MTLVSLISEWLVLIALIGYIVAEIMARRGIPAWAVVVAGFLFLETAFRFLIVWTQSRPAGSAAGVVFYVSYWLLSGRGKDSTPFANIAGHAAPIAAAPPERQRSDALLLLEPLATLLPASDQWRLRERYGYDYRRLSATVAGVILSFAILGIFTAVIGRAVVSGLVAAVIAAEQIARLVAFRRGPAPSVLGWIVRPLLRKLL